MVTVADCHSSSGVAPVMYFMHNAPGTVCSGADHLFGVAEVQLVSALGFPS